MQLFDLNRQSPAPATTETPGISETPASTTTSETSETSSTSEAPATSEAVPATINATSTGEPVNQAPTPGTTETPEAPATSEASAPEIATSETPASTATIDTDTTHASTTSETLETATVPETTSENTSTAAAEDIRNDSGLPSGYLADGWTDEQGILRREYVENYAEEIAEKLKGMRASTYHLAFLSEAKTLRKKKTPYSQQKLCTMQMATAAKKLTSRKKDPAPAILLEVIKAATEAVVDSETFQMLYLHLDAIYSYLLDN